MHTAPSHGADDFYTGQKYGLDLTCRVDAGGRIHADPEAWQLATIGGAVAAGDAVGLGAIEPGRRADLVLLDSPAEHVAYRLGHNPVAAAFIAGEPAHVRPDAEWRITPNR